MSKQKKILQVEQALIKEVNRLANANDLYWLAGIVRKTHKVLDQSRDRLHPIAVIALDHYNKSPSDVG